MRTSEAHWHSEALRGSDHDIGTHLTGRREHTEREQIGGNTDESSSFVCFVTDSREIAHRSQGVWILKKTSEGIGRENELTDR
jgi:hypothetical protein